MSEDITVQKLVAKLQTIKDGGFVKTHRPNDTGVGKTLEDLLEIPENNLQIPDVGTVELKSKRVDSNSMLTIATKAPQPKGANKALFDKAKYPDRYGNFVLHSTVYGSKPNPQSLQILVLKERLTADNKYKVDVYWPLTVLDDVLTSKSGKIVLVFAQTKGKPKTTEESFNYTEAYLLEGLSIKKLEQAVKTDKLKIDFRMGTYRSGKNKGKPHDHGTAFRINKRDFLELYDRYTKLI